MMLSSDNTQCENNNSDISYEAQIHDDAFSSSNTDENIENHSDIKQKTEREFTQSIKHKKDTQRHHVYYVSLCLEESFDYEELRSYCSKNFPHVSRRLSGNDGFDLIISKMVQYCGEHNKYEEFWSWMKEDRPHNYHIYYPQWEKAYQRKEEEKYRQTNNLNRPSSSQTDDRAIHPLNMEDDNSLSDWFFNTLSQQEQSMVMTVALFEGMNRREMTAITQDIHNLLFGKEAD